jgi:diguanylate cyclase (GGDEF)-like protein
MNPVNDDRLSQPAEGRWGRALYRFTAWIVAGPRPQPGEIEQKLLHSSMTKKNTLIVVHLSMAVMAVIAIALTRQSWAYCWLLAEVGLGAVRLTMHIAYERAVARGQPGNATAPIFAGLVWASVLSAAATFCVVSGQWLLILLIGSSLASVIGGISSRNAGTPRYGIILMCILTLPYAAATLVSPLPLLFLVGLQVPFYIAAVTVVLLENYRTLLGLYHAERENLRLARHDLLTGLPNRIMKLQRFDELLRERRSALQDSRQDSLTVFWLDLDGFKDVNDTYGHATGDAVLIAVADRLRASVRDVDFLCRVGGDEFVILLPGISAVEAADVARRIIARVSEPFEVGNTTLRIGISVGSACAPHDGVTADELLRSADRAMYQAKRRGKGLLVAHSVLTVETVELAPPADADAQMSLAFPVTTEAANSAAPGFEAF